MKRMAVSLRNRRGMAIVLVLGLLALTLGFSYALLRNNTTDHILERNQSRKTDARTAAQAGMAVALRKLYDGTWNGADSTFTGDLTTDKLQGFMVTYTTGDSSLNSSSSDWNEYPYRLTIDSKGYSIDPTTSASRSEYTIRVVAQMVRRKLNTNLVTTSGLESYSLYQSKNNNARIHHPVRINGNLMLQGELEFSRQYPQAHQSSAYLTFFDDLRKMYEFNNAWDYRTFSGRLDTPSSRQPASGDVPLVLDARLKVPRTNVAVSSTSPVPATTSFSAYKLYAKGKEYTGQVLPLQDDTSDLVPSANYLVTPGTYAPDPQTNPLGVFKSSQSSLGITSNTSIQGLLLASGSDSSDVNVAGTAVALQASALPALVGDSTIYRLPVVSAEGNIRIHDGSSRTIDGWLVCNKFELPPGASSSAITVTGGVFCHRLYLDHRTTAVQDSTLWSAAYAQFQLQILPSGTSAYFPGWLDANRSDWGLYLEPRLIFNATPDGVKNHVPDFSQPIYVADPGDGGMLWDIVRWQEIGS